VELELQLARQRLAQQALVRRVPATYFISLPISGESFVLRAGLSSRDFIRHKGIESVRLKASADNLSAGLFYYFLKNNFLCHSRESGNPESKREGLDPRIRGDDMIRFLFFSFSVKINKS
jgi:hypothetical protein